VYVAVIINEAPALLFHMVGRGGAATTSSPWRVGNGTHGARHHDVSRFRPEVLQSLHPKGSTSDIPSTSQTEARWPVGTLVPSKPLSTFGLRNDTLVSATCLPEQERASESETQGRNRSTKAQDIEPTFTHARSFTQATFVCFVLVGFALGSAICGELHLLLSGMLRAAAYMILMSFLWKFIDRVRSGVSVRSLLSRAYGLFAHEPTRNPHRRRTVSNVCCLFLASTSDAGGVPKPHQPTEIGR